MLGGAIGSPKHSWPALTVRRAVAGQMLRIRQVISPPRLLILLVPPIAVLLGRAVATGRLKYAIAGSILPLGAWVVSRRLGGLLVGVALILVVPSWITFGSAQLDVLRLASVLAMTAVLVARGFRPNRIDAAVVVLSLASVMSVALQGEPGASKVLINEMIVLGFYVGARVIETGEVGKVMTAAHLLGALGALTVLYEWRSGHVIFGDSTSYSWNATDSTFFRPGGIFGSPPGAATVLAVTAILGLPAMRAASSPRVRWVLSISLLVTVLASFTTLTRASLIGLAAGAVVYLWLSRSALVSPLRVVISALVLILVVMVALPLATPSATFQKAFVRSGNLASRASIWRLALPIVFDSPAHTAFGYGAESTVVADQGGAAPAALASSPDLIRQGTHNQYVLSLLEQGLVGLAAFLGLLVVLLVAGVKLTRMLPGDPAAAALTGCVAAFAIIALVNNALLHGPSFAMLALAGGLLAARVQAAEFGDRRVGDAG